MSTLIILSFVAGVYNYRGHNYGQVEAELQGRETFNAGMADLEHNLFNSSLNHTREISRNGEHLTRIRNQERYDRLNEMSLAKGKPTQYLLTAGSPTYNTPLFPLMPSHESTFYSAGMSLSETQGLVFPTASGYVLSKDAFYSDLKWSFKTTRLTTLSERISQRPSNWSLRSFRDEAEEIKSAEVTKQEISGWLESEIKEQPNPRIERLTQRLSNKIDRDQIRRVRFVHFVPAVVINFMLYYLINGAVVSIYRKFSSSKS
jgi:hypothetical protein